MSVIDEQPRSINPAQWRIVAVIIAYAVAALLYRLLKHQHLGHSAAMFLGLPAVLAILLALAPKTQTATGGILKGITLALLAVAPLLDEGFVCILVAAPIFYIVGILVGVATDWHRSRRGVTLSCVALVLLPMSLEGVVPQLTFRRAQTVEVESVLASPVDNVEHALAHSLRVTTPLPLPLRIGFPKPLAASGEGLAIGDTRTIHFAAAEGAPAGDLLMRVAARRPGYARFETVSDASKLAQWLKWTSSEVEWKPLDGARTAVTWRIHFERELDPAWYFSPWERAAVRQAAAYLIAANAAPAGSN